MKKRILFLLVTLFAVSCMFVGCDGSSSHSRPPRPSVAENPFQKGPMQVGAIIPVYLGGRSPDEQVLLTALQGIVATKSTTQLFLYNDDDSYFASKDDTDKGLTSGTRFIKYYLTTLRDKPIPAVTPPEPSWR